MRSIRVINDGDFLRVMAPYHAVFRKRASQLGRWKNNYWHFPVRYEQQVRDLLRAVYGTDGTPVPTVILRIRLDEVGRIMYDELMVGTVRVLKKWDRDQAPVLGEGCAVVVGSLYARGGSRNNPQITFEKGTVVEVLDVPESLARGLVGEDPDAYMIVEEEGPPDTLTPAEVSLLESLRTLDPARLQLVLSALNEAH